MRTAYGLPGSGGPTRCSSRRGRLARGRCPRGRRPARGRWRVHRHNHARIRLRTGGWIELDRDPGRALYTVPAPLSPEELVHPFLDPVAAVCGRWHGRESIHGGRVALGDTACGIVGGRHGGKSSLLAALAVGGTDVVCDDVLVVDGRDVFAGPRTVDLREDAAAALGVGAEIGLAGARERRRLRLGPLDRPLTLGGCSPHCPPGSFDAPLVGVVARHTRTGARRARGRSTGKVRRRAWSPRRAQRGRRRTGARRRPPRPSSRLRRRAPTTSAECRRCVRRRRNQPSRAEAAPQA